MKTFILIFLLATVSYCQDSDGFVLYGNTGYGLSVGGYQQAKGGTLARLGVSVGYYHLLLKFDRTVNNEFTTLIPPEKASSYSFLMGLSVQPFKKRSEIIINGKIGVGKGESIKRGKIITYKLFDDEYELTTEKYSTKMFEIDLELRFKNVGLYIGVFSESFQRTNIYGAAFGGIFGLF
jgi:hypothetical protein